MVTEESVNSSTKQWLTRAQRNIQARPSSRKHCRIPHAGKSDMGQAQHSFILAFDSVPVKEENVFRAEEFSMCGSLQSRRQPSWRGLLLHVAPEFPRNFICHASGAHSVKESRFHLREDTPSCNDSNFGHLLIKAYDELPGNGKQKDQ
eukprot:1161542-Pelagomonas_calceolata.AAC.1